MPDPPLASRPAQAASVAAQLLLDRPPGLGAIRLGVVDGPSGSGKSTFARLWAHEVLLAGTGTVSVFSSDLLATWEGPFDWWPRFDAGVLGPLAARDGRQGAGDRLVDRDAATGGMAGRSADLGADHRGSVLRSRSAR